MKKITHKILIESAINHLNEMMSYQYGKTWMTDELPMASQLLNKEFFNKMPDKYYIRLMGITLFDILEKLYIKPYERKSKDK